MPRRWSPEEEKEKRRELAELYEHQNRSIGEIAELLGITPTSVYDRLLRLNISIQRHLKPGTNKARLIPLPAFSGDLAEFCGIMLGDGHIGTGQLWVTVNAKTDLPYVTARRDAAAVALYLTSSSLVRNLQNIGLHSPNKVRDQVGVPAWIFSSTDYRQRFLRGFFDTDGSIYRLKWFDAAQMSFSNRSRPLLDGTRQALLDLEYHPSRVSDHSVYLTRRRDIERYIQEIGFGNAKHRQRAAAFGVMPTVAHT